MDITEHLPECTFLPENQTNYHPELVTKSKQWYESFTPSGNPKCPVCKVEAKFSEDV